MPAFNDPELYQTLYLILAIGLGWIALRFVDEPKKALAVLGLLLVDESEMAFRVGDARAHLFDAAHARTVRLMKPRPLRGKLV